MRRCLMHSAILFRNLIKINESAFIALKFCKHMKILDDNNALQLWLSYHFVLLFTTIILNTI